MASATCPQHDRHGSFVATRRTFYQSLPVFKAQTIFCLFDTQGLRTGIPIFGGKLSSQLLARCNEAMLHNPVEPTIQLRQICDRKACNPPVLAPCSFWQGACSTLHCSSAFFCAVLKRCTHCCLQLMGFWKYPKMHAQGSRKTKRGDFLNSPFPTKMLPCM